MTVRSIIAPHWIFLIAAVICGVIYKALTPALQAPDEFDHFNRAYRISEGDFLPVKQNRRLGGNIPASLRQFESLYRPAATTLQYNLPKQTDSVAFSIPYTSANEIFVDFPTTSYYSPVSYLPQAIALFVMKHQPCSAGSLYYYSRVFCYCFWVICMFFFIMQVTIGKWLFTVLCLLPMPLYLANSFSADTMSNILSFLFLGAVLKYALDEKNMTPRRIAWLVLLALLLALAKLVYVGLVLSIFIIPASKFRGKPGYFIFSGLLFLVSIAAAYFWSNIVMAYYTPYGEYDLSASPYLPLTNCSDYNKQRDYILDHPLYFPGVLYRTLFDHPYTYLNSYIGNFGNYDIPIGKRITVISWITIPFIVIFEATTSQLKRSKKLILFGAAAASFILLVLSQHLMWDCVGEGVVDFLHGRYLIAIFPFVFLGLTGLFPKLKFPVGIAAVIFISLVNKVAVHIIDQRYNHEWFSEEVRFTCGAEKETKGFLLTTNDSIKLVEYASKNDSVAHTGKSSLLLSKVSPYGFTYRIKNLNKGDRIEVFAWQKGAGAHYIIAGKGKNCKEFNAPSVPVIYGDTTKWNRVHMLFVMGEKCDSTQATFFIWNPNNTKVYVDDLEFSHKKFSRDYLAEFGKRLSLFD